MKKDKTKIAAAAMAVMTYIAQENEHEAMGERASRNANCWAMSSRPRGKGLLDNFPWRFSLHPGRR